MNRRISSFPFGFVTVGLLGLLGGAHAADGGDSYAVVALVGNEITVTTYQPAVGSSIDQNIQTHVTLPDDHFDRLAARVASNAIRKAVPDAEVRTITLADDGAFGNVDDPAGADQLKSLIAAVQPLPGANDAHYLLVLSKYRSQARLKTYSASVGSGKLSGLGFYVDATKRMRKITTGEGGRGFIAPYAYMMVTLVDLRTGTVIRSNSAVETTTRANVGPDSTLDPWTALSADEKLRILDNLVGRALQRVVPQIVAPG